MEDKPQRVQRTQCTACRYTVRTNAYGCPVPHSPDGIETSTLPQCAYPRVVHCKQEEYDVYIGRPSKWGNPFSHKTGTLAQHRVKTVDEAVSAYETWLLLQTSLLADLPELRGKVLGCWCNVTGVENCHGYVLLRYANRPSLR